MRCKLLLNCINPLQVISIYAIAEDHAKYSEGYRTWIETTGNRWWCGKSVSDVERELAECLSSCVHQSIEREVIVEKEVTKLEVTKLVAIPKEFEPVMGDMGIVLEWLDIHSRAYMRNDERDALRRVMNQITSPTTTGEK